MKKFVLDSETSGLKPGFHEITELSILRCEDMVQKVWLLNINHPERFSKQAIMVTGQNLHEISKRKRFLKDSIKEINEFLEEDGETPDDRVIIAHNGSFDRAQIECVWGSKAFPANYWLDTCAMARKYIKTKLKPIKKQSAALDRLLILFKINAELGAHSAEVDVRNTFRVWKYLENRGMSNVEFTKLSPKIIKESMEIYENDNYNLLDDLEQD